MKKIILGAAIAVLTITGMNAQETTFGVKAGFSSASATVEAGGQDVSASESGFFVGVVADFTVSDQFHVTPSALYTNIDDTGFLQIPVLGKYLIGEGGFNVQAGPQFNLILEETADDFSSLSVGLTGGLGYDFTEKFFAEAHYHLQLTNSFTGDGDITARTDFFSVGVGYRF